MRYKKDDEDLKFYKTKDDLILSYNRSIAPEFGLELIIGSLMQGIITLDYFFKNSEEISLEFVDTIIELLKNKDLRFGGENY